MTFANLSILIKNGIRDTTNYKIGNLSSSEAAARMQLVPDYMALLIDKDIEEIATSSSSVSLQRKVGSDIPGATNWQDIEFDEYSKQQF